MSSKIIWDFLKKEGFSDFGVAGLMGNLDAESALRPNNLQDTYSRSLGLSDVEYTAKVDNGTYTNFVCDSAGYGLAQWTYWSRKENLLNYAKSKKKSIGDLEMQLEFLVKELRTSYKNSVYNILVNATTVQQASDVVLMNFERPANAAAQKSKRAAMGQVYYDKYAKGVENTIMATNTYKKGQKTKLSENFNSLEFDCHGSGCCSETIINPKLVEYVQKIRDHFGKSITVTSGYRCPVHNKRIGGATGSRHSKGDAADIVVAGVAPREVAKYAESIGIKGIGLYETNADGHFTHVDTRDVKSFWYGQNEAKRTTFGGSTSTSDPSPAPVQPSINNDVLSIGDTGEDVRELQEWLVKLGYNVGSKGPDGDFGSKTYAAIIDFQRKYNLKDDGIVGPLTKNAIKEAIKNMEQNIVIPEEEQETFKIGDLVKLLPESTFVNGQSIPKWVINSKIYIRSNINDRNDTVSFSISKTGPITGVTKITNLVKYSEDIAADNNFESYIVQVTADKLNVRAGAGTKYKIVSQLDKFDLYTIVAEVNGWGKLKDGSGWISLEYTKRFL